MNNQPTPAQCPQCKGKRTIRVLGSGGDYEDWACPTCRPKEAQRDDALIYGAEDGESD